MGGRGLIVAFPSTREVDSRGEAVAWLTTLAAAQSEGQFFFNSTPVLTLAVAA